MMKAKRMNAQDRKILMDAIQDANRKWKVGDVCKPFKGTKLTKVAKVVGDTVTLANGQSGHMSNLRTSHYR